jgi:hypothetical protein
VLVLEDLGNRGQVDFGTFDRPLDADTLAGVLDALATLHAARWDDPDLARRPLSDGMLDGGMLDGFLSEVNWDQQMARPRGNRVPAELTDHRRVTSAIRRAWRAKRGGPASLFHGDPHIGNYFFDRAGAPSGSPRHRRCRSRVDRGARSLLAPGCRPTATTGPAERSRSRPLWCWT